MSLFTKIITGIFGKKSEKDLKLLAPFIEEINAAFEPLKSLSDDELKQRFQDIRNELKEISDNSRKTFKAEGLEEEELEEAILKVEQEYLDNKMVEVFAIVKDASRRLCGTEFTVMHQKMGWEMVPFDVQLMGGVALHQGKIAEMKTGEGKTLVSQCPLF